MHAVTLRVQNNKKKHAGILNPVKNKKKQNKTKSFFNVSHFFISIFETIIANYQILWFKLELPTFLSTTVIANLNRNVRTPYTYTRKTLH